VPTITPLFADPISVALVEVGLCVALVANGTWQLFRSTEDLSNNVQLVIV
jgi:hypothetical protein